ncbi:pyruvate kinase [Siminovitchia sp. FSL W7-1587]|uniref:pyruvate kinase n=1 Tax=Siminovitchia sp. FSL W7-1587 TaxID=2954699 RepID=UPI0030D391D8
MTDLASRIQSLYEQVVTEVERAIAQYPVRQGEKSRNNLLAYHALQKHPINDLEMLLKERGLSSVRESLPHIMYTLQKIMENLGVHFLPPSHLSALSPFEARLISRIRTDLALGNIVGGRHTRIMVTLDSRMLDQPSIMDHLLINGMEIARINCAHDHPDIWESLIQMVRESEQRLHIPCKIYMDLAGPKVRLGAFHKEKKPLKIQVPTDLSGKWKEVSGFLDLSAPESKVMKGIDGQNTFVLAVRNKDMFKEAQKGDDIFFRDVKNRPRTLKIDECVSHSRMKVTVDQTSLIDEHVVFQHKAGKFSIHSIHPSPVEIKVKRGDILRLYLNEARPGHAATEHEPAGVPVTLPKAFRNVMPDDRIFIDDGKINGVVHQVQKDFIDVKIQFPTIGYAKVKEGKGINLPDSLVDLNVPAITEKDFQESAFQHLARIIIEGLNFQRFAVMIARGDLVIETGPEHLSHIQDEILAMCTAAHIPVIWATGILERLTKKGIPARSEITDASYGKRADAVMLNKGPYIIQSVKLLDRLLQTGDEFISGSPYRQAWHQPGLFIPSFRKKLPVRQHM